MTAAGSDGPDDSRRRRAIKFYRSPTTGRSTAREELDALAPHGRAALLEAMKRFRAGDERRGEVTKLKKCDDIWEIRVRVDNDPFRALFFYDTDIICVCVTAFYKNQQKTPEDDKDRARKRKRAWEQEGRDRRAAP